MDHNQFFLVQPDINYNTSVHINKSKSLFVYLPTIALGSINNNNLFTLKFKKIQGSRSAVQYRR